MSEEVLSAKPRSIFGKLLFGVVFGFIVLLILSLLGDVKAVQQTISQFDWKYFLFALLFTLFNYILRFFKWHYYVNSVNNCGLSMLESLRIFIAGFPLAVTPGKVGEVLKGVWLKQ